MEDIHISVPNFLSFSLFFDGNAVMLCGELLLTLLLLQFLVAYITHRNKPFTNWPLFGSLPAVILNIDRILDWITDSLRHAGGTIIAHSIALSGMVTVMTCNPQNIEYMLRSNFDNFPRGEDFHEMLDVLGEGVLNTDGDVWLKQRKIASAHLQAKNFRSFSANNTKELIRVKMIPVLNRFALSGEAFNLQDVILRFTFDNISKTVFGTDYNCLADQDGNYTHDEHPFAQTADKLTELILYRHVLPPWMRQVARRFKLGMEREAAKTTADAHRFLDEAIALKKMLLLIKNEELADQDLLGRYMLQFPNKDDEVFLRDTCLNMLAAGRDTTGAALTWFFLLICKNPRVKTKILDELKTILTKNPNRSYFETEDLADMVYLQAAIHETLRLYPSVPLDHRGVIVKDRLPDGTVVKPGMVIIYAIYSVGRMEWIWGKDCMEFRPERWIDDEGKLKHEINSFRFLAFNGGPRTCLGKDMSITTMKLLAAEVLMNFDFEVLNEEKIVPKTSMILSMKDGLFVRATKKMIMI